MYSYLLRFLSLIAAAVLLYLNLEIWSFSWLSVGVIIFYFWLISSYYQAILVQRFGFGENFRSRVLGGFILLSIFGFIAGALIILWKLNSITLVLNLIICGLFGALLSPLEVKESEPPVIEEADDGAVLVDRKSYLAVFFAFAVLGFVSLYMFSASGKFLTPWQVLPGYYIYLYFLLLLLSGSLIFSKFKIWAVLAVLCIQFLLAFSYLPLSHDLFWGADGWRHKAVIDNVVSSGKVSITNFSESSNWVSRLNPGIFSYSQYWGILSSLTIATGLDSIQSIAWFQPILAAILIPVLLYEIGRALRWSKRNSLLLAWLALLPFALQMAGAFTLPVSLGFVFFLAFLLLLLRRFSEKRKGQIPVLCFLLILSFFGYALYTILIIFIFAAAELLMNLKFLKEKLGTALWAVFGLCAFSIVSVLELIAGYARFDSNINFIGALSQAVGNFSGYFLASGPRPHLIDTGNIFFNQIPSYAFVANGLTSWRWWIVIFMILFFAAAIIGFRKMLKNAEVTEKFLAILGIGLFASYVVTRYFLAGDHIISRRLDAMIAFFGIIFFLASVRNLVNRNKFVSMFLVLVFSIASAASYSLGPYSRVMSGDEYHAAQFVWSSLKDESSNCVVAETYPLLAIEALSMKKIVGGGFLIDENFAQPELEELYTQLSADPERADWQIARDLTGSNWCYLIAPKIESDIFLPLQTYGGLSIYRK